MATVPCRTCHQLEGIDEYDQELWSIYHRLRDGRSSYEPLVYTSDWLQENVMDDEDHAAVVHSMERDMHRRGLCVTCGRPNLTNIGPDDIMDEDEARELAEMWAEQAAERRAGC